MRCKGAPKHDDDYLKRKYIGKLTVVFQMELEKKTFRFEDDAPARKPRTIAEVNKACLEIMEQRQRIMDISPESCHALSDAIDPLSMSRQDQLDREGVRRPHDSVLPRVQSTRMYGNDLP